MKWTVTTVSLYFLSIFEGDCLFSIPSNSGDPDRSVHNNFLSESLFCFLTINYCFFFHFFVKKYKPHSLCVSILIVYKYSQCLVKIRMILLIFCFDNFYLCKCYVTFPIFKFSFRLHLKLYL